MKSNFIATYFVAGFMLIASPVSNGLETPSQIDAKNSGTLQALVKGLSPNKGEIILTVYPNKKAYMKDDRQSFTFLVGDAAQQVVELQDLDFAEISVGVIYDENSNKKMDTKIFGIPAEPVGFSNNAKGKFGPPSFEQTKFKFSENMQQIEIQLLRIGK